MLLLKQSLKIFFTPQELIETEWLSNAFRRPFKICFRVENWKYTTCYFDTFSRWPGRLLKIDFKFLGKHFSRFKRKKQDRYVKCMTLVRMLGIDRLKKSYVRAAVD